MHRLGHVLPCCTLQCYAIATLYRPRLCPSFAIHNLTKPWLRLIVRRVVAPCHTLALLHVAPRHPALPLLGATELYPTLATPQRAVLHRRHTLHCLALSSQASPFHCPAVRYDTMPLRRSTAPDPAPRNSAPTMLCFTMLRQTAHCCTPRRATSPLPRPVPLCHTPPLPHITLCSPALPLPYHAASYFAHAMLCPALRRAADRNYATPSL